ncbi:MAG: serine/threonine protein kinase, partial [Candidatus Dadabacteria bacterium]
MPHVGTAGIAPGTILFDRYKVGDFLGKGANGEVYSCCDIIVPSLPVAMKVVKVGGLSKKAKRRLAREAQIINAINHDHVAKLYDFYYSDGKSYMFMEHVNGGTLREYIDKYAPVTPGCAFNFLMQIATALTAIHKMGIVHRDIKPSNVLVIGDSFIKVSDFGVAYIPESEEEFCGLEEIGKDMEWLSQPLVKRLTTSNVMLGTAYYFSPEYIESGIVDGRLDVYAAGVIAYELLTGGYPFESETVYGLFYEKRKKTISSLNRADCPKVFEEIVLRALSLDPEERFKDGSELLAAISKAREVLDYNPVTNEYYSR